MSSLTQRRAFRSQAVSTRRLARSASDIEIQPFKKREYIEGKFNFDSIRNFKVTKKVLYILFILSLSLRITFMDRGLYHLIDMNQHLDQMQENLVFLKQQNDGLKSEIKQIKSSPRYQRKMAREHLGVIAKDEYLILFERDLDLSSN